MKKIKMLFLTFIVFLTTSFVNSNDWYLLDSNEFGFKIEFPVKPTEKVSTVNSEIGLMKLNNFIYDASKKGNDDNFVYSICVSEYPDSVINSSKTEKLDAFFRKAIDGTVKSYHGKLLIEKIIEFEKYPGREIKIDFKEGLAIVKMRCYLIKNRMYILTTITETKKDFNLSINKFMDSFALK